jgi:uncharacterized membrane protein
MMSQSRANLNTQRHSAGDSDRTAYGDEPTLKIQTKGDSQMAKLEISTVINRPVEVVFAFLSNPENGPKWNSSSGEVTITSGGPVGVGTTYRSVRTFLGQRIESETEITEYEPNQRLASKAISGPFPMESLVTFEPVEGGTRVTGTLIGEPGGFFKLAEPVLVSRMKQQFEADLAKLKDMMEAYAL